MGLYAPQFEQFGIELAGEGPVFTGKVATEDAEGSAWVMPLGSSCLVMERVWCPGTTCPSWSGHPSSTHA